MFSEDDHHHRSEPLGCPIAQVHFRLGIVQPMKQLPGCIAEVKEWLGRRSVPDQVPPARRRLDGDGQRRPQVCIGSRLE
jgi:hypothetical protein